MWVVARHVDYEGMYEEHFNTSEGVVEHFKAFTELEREDMYIRPSTVEYSYEEFMAGLV